MDDRDRVYHRGVRDAERDARWREEERHVDRERAIADALEWGMHRLRAMGWGCEKPSDIMACTFFRETVMDELELMRSEAVMGWSGMPEGVRAAQAQTRSIDPQIRVAIRHLKYGSE